MRARNKEPKSGEHNMPFGGFGGEYWDRYFREVFIAEVDLFAGRFRRALPSDGEITALANKAEKKRLRA